MAGSAPVDWAFGETLAFGALALDGVAVRIEKGVGAGVKLGQRDAREMLVDRPPSMPRPQGSKPGKKPAGWATARPKPTNKKPTGSSRSPRTRK